MGKVNFNEEEREFLSHATPVARKFAAMQVKAGKKFEEIEDEIIDIIATEAKVYDEIKKPLVKRIKRHGLDAEAIGYFKEFQDIDLFVKTKYQGILKKLHNAYVKSEGKKRSLEYLILRINEFIQKTDRFRDVAYDLLQRGKKPDFEAWCDKVVLQDNLFEENKQFLKQTLHHLEVLYKNKVKLGGGEMRLLLYNKDVCRNEKFYRLVEEWIVRIYYNLASEQERAEVYHEVCQFVADIVPQVGYISLGIISFIFDGGFLSQDSRDLLVKIKPIVCKLHKEPLIEHPLRDMYEKRSKLSAETQQSLEELVQLYLPAK